MEERQLHPGQAAGWPLARMVSREGLTAAGYPPGSAALQLQLAVQLSRWEGQGPGGGAA